MNYFELFGLPVSFTIDKNELSRKYVELQKKYHPDFYTLESEADQADALEKSSLINKAWKTLCHPDETLKYVLELKGVLEEDEKYQLPPDFLMEMMELNEEADENTPAKVAAIEQELFSEVKTILKNYDENTTAAEDLRKLKAYYFKKKYLNRILDRTRG
ncbi:MAG: Fe-S protein assembly co-chaperone HscB [Ferruginibacter sp.]